MSASWANSARRRESVSEKKAWGPKAERLPEKPPGSHVEIEEFGSIGAFMDPMMIYHLASHMGEWV
jgi:hypothetical protein